MLLVSLLATLGPAGLPAGDVPRPAEPLTLNALQGQPISLQRLRGKVVAVFFFNTDCGHCKQTTRVINPIYEQWQSRGLEILGFATNSGAARNLGAFVREFNVKFPVGLSSSKECTRFAEIPIMTRYYVPYMFFVDRKGVVREEHSGGDRAFYRNEALNIRALLDALLKEPAPKPARGS